MIHANSHAVGWVSLRRAPMHRWEPRSLLAFRLHVPPTLHRSTTGKQPGQRWKLHVDTQQPLVILRLRKTIDTRYMIIYHASQHIVNTDLGVQRRVRSTYARRAQNKHRPTSAPQRHRKAALRHNMKDFVQISCPFGSAEHAPSGVTQSSQRV